MALADQLPADRPDFSQMAKGIVAELVDAQVIEKVWKGQEPVLVKVVEIFLGTAMGLIGTLGAQLAESMINAEDIAGPAFNRLASTALRDITGIDVDLSTRPGQRGARAGAARNVGAGILQALTGISNGAAGAGGELQPSTQAAEDYLTFMVQMSLEGWLQGLTGELFTAGAVDSLGDLDDTLANALGLARVSRAVIRPFVSATVSTPAEWQINKTYRPTLLGAAEAIRQFLRGRWTPAQMTEELARHGYSDDRIEALVNAQRKFLSVGELYDQFELELTSDDEAIQHLRDQGYDEHAAAARWQLERKQPFLKEQDAIAAALISAYASWQIDDFTFDRELANSGIRPYIHTFIRRTAERRREVNRPQLSDSEFREAVRLGIRNVIDYRGYLRRRGFTEDDVATKELMLRRELDSSREADELKRRQTEERAAEKAAAAAKRAEREAELAAERAVTEPTRKDVAAAFVRGLVSEDYYRDFLATSKYAPDTIAFLIELARQDRAAYVADQARRAELESRAREIELNLGQLERAVAGGYLSVSEYGGILRSRGYVAGDVELLQRLAQDKADQAEDARRRRELADQKAAAAGLSLAQLDAAVLRGVITFADYDARLAAAGVGDVDRAILAQLVNVKLAELADERARRDANEAKARARGLSLGDFERAVLAGLKTLDEYAAALIRAGFEPAAATTMRELLALDVETRQAAAAARQAAAERASSRGLSLSDLERAVRWNVLTLAEYRAALDALGYKGSAQDVIVETFVRELQAQRDEEARREEIRSEAGRRALPLADIERAVLAGWLTLDEYAQRLDGFGYSADDREILVKLLGDELAEVERQRAVRDQAAGELGARQLSLGDFEAAVKAGVRTIDEYGAFLSTQGFDQAARSTLVALLARELQDVNRAQVLREAVAGAGGARDISVSQSEALVRAKLRTIDEHFAWLEAQGFSDSDAALLSLLLESQLAAAAAKQPGTNNNQ